MPALVDWMAVGVSSPQPFYVRLSLHVTFAYLIQAVG
jgi:hypothetical protein